MGLSSILLFQSGGLGIVPTSLLVVLYPCDLIVVFRAGHTRAVCWLQYILGSLRFLFHSVRPRIFLMPCYLVLDDIAISLFRLTSPGAQCRPPFFFFYLSWNQLTCAF